MHLNSTRRFAFSTASLRSRLASGLALCRGLQRKAVRCLDPAPSKMDLDRGAFLIERDRVGSLLARNVGASSPPTLVVSDDRILVQYDHLLMVAHVEPRLPPRFFAPSHFWVTAPTLAQLMSILVYAESLRQGSESPKICISPVGLDLL